MDVTVREAVWADGRRIRDVHVDAIEGLASRAYDETQIAAWAGDREPDDYAIDSRETYFVVAERGDRLLGFGSLKPEAGDYFQGSVDGEVNAVYVRPEVARNGIGSRIYAALEERARAALVESLGLWASVNAVAFYEAHGYEQVAERVHEFGEGVEGPAVEMRKALSEPDGGVGRDVG